MTTHADAAQVAASLDHAPAASTAVLDSQRFEKSELMEFSESDRTAGEHVGILLAVLFCLSVVLFSSVAVWMMYNQAEGHDPHTITGASEEHH